MGGGDRIRLRKLVAIAGTLTAIVLAPIVYAAFLALTVTTTVDVNEPLRILVIGRAGPEAVPLVCTISATGTSATCSVGLFAGDAIIVNVVIGNAASVPIDVTFGASSYSPDIIITCDMVSPPSACPVTVAVPPGLSPGFGAVYGVKVSQSAPPGSFQIAFFMSR